MVKNNPLRHVWGIWRKACQLLWTLSVCWQHVLCHSAGKRRRSQAALLRGVCTGVNLNLFLLSRKSYNPILQRGGKSGVGGKCEVKVTQKSTLRSQGNRRRQSLKEGECDPAVFWAEADYEKQKRPDEKWFKPYSLGATAVQYDRNFKQLKNDPVNLCIHDHDNPNM